MKPLNQQPGLTEQVYQALLAEICAGRMPPGTHVVQEQVAAGLNVSRQPVQQALALLKSEGLLKELGRRGLFVAPLEVATMRQHYEIRAALDGLAARRAAERAAASKDVAREIEREGASRVAAGAAAIATGAVAALVQRDVEFHAFLYAATGNPLIATTAEPHWRYLRLVMSEVLRHAEPPPEIWRQHQDILDAIVSGNARRAEQLAIEHVETARIRLEPALAAPIAEPTTAGGGAPSRSNRNRA